MALPEAIAAAMPWVKRIAATGRLVCHEGNRQLSTFLRGVRRRRISSGY
jgi:hypothetical protein